MIMEYTNRKLKLPSRTAELMFSTKMTFENFSQRSRLRRPLPDPARSLTAEGRGQFFPTNQIILCSQGVKRGFGSAIDLQSRQC